MSTDERRNEILEMLRSSDRCITANDFSEKFGVTRQVIVGDIAILRANGHRISSAKNGYSIPKDRMAGVIESVVCRHGKEQARDELYAIVDNGASIMNVTVEHPIYGQISGELNLRSRYEVDEYLAAVEESGASQLADLTGGLHIHTLTMPDMEIYERIVKKLSEMGILVTQEQGE